MSSPDSESVTRVLLIEDDPVFAEIVRVYLRHPAAQSIAFERVERLDEGLERLESADVDAVLLDLKLPDSRGYDTFRRVQEHRPPVPIVVLTGDEDDRLAQKAMSRGAQDYLFKTDLTPGLLARSIRYAVERAGAEARRRLAAARLEESERRYRAVVEDQTELVCRFRPAGELTFANQAFGRFFGDEPAALIGRDLFSLFPEEDRVAVATHLADLDRERPIRSREQRLQLPGGEVKWLQWTDRALFGEAGELAEYQSVGRDTTERRRLEDQLHQSQKMEVVGQLVGGIAHDFNNILTAVGGYGDLLAERQRAAGGEPSPEVAALKKIVRGAAALTGQLLAFSRRQVVQPEILELNELIQGVDALLHQLIGEHIELQLDLAPGPLLVKADPGRIEQVIVNLAVNARDAMPMGGRLGIATRSLELAGDRARKLQVATGSCVSLAVADTGYGMDEGVREKIFEPFFTTKSGLGTGLGLATVDRIVGELGGHIAVESAPEAGATFEILLPATAVPPPFGEASGVWPAVDAGGSERVLLVEDDEPVRSVLKAILEGRGYSVRSARNSERALELLADTGDGFDVLLTDVVMAGLSGPELAERVRRSAPRIKVLFISGYAEDNASFERVRTSGFPLLHKPFSARRLLGKLREVLDGPL